VTSIFESNTTHIMTLGESPRPTTVVRSRRMTTLADEESKFPSNQPE
jgi:hypothetical protein